MASHRLSAVPRAIRRHQCSGRKKVRKCSCFRTIRTVTFTLRIKERSKYVAFRRRMLAILCVRHWVWPVRRQYVLFSKWHPSTIFRRQSYKSARPIKRCPREVSQCCRVVQLERRRHAFAGTRMACRCKRVIDWLLCRVDHWKSTVSQSDHSSCYSSNQIIIIFPSCLPFADLQSADTGHYTCTASSESGETSWSASLTVSYCFGAARSSLLFFLLLVHRVLMRKTFHFLHYDYEKLFQFILISLRSLASLSCDCWIRMPRCITLFGTVSIDAWKCLVDIHIHFYFSFSSAGVALVGNRNRIYDSISVTTLNEAR